MFAGIGADVAFGLGAVSTVVIFAAALGSSPNYRRGDRGRDAPTERLFGVRNWASGRSG